MTNASQGMLAHLLVRSLIHLTPLAVVDGAHLRATPDAIEAFFDEAASQRLDFIAKHGRVVPLVRLQRHNWRTPFICMEGCDAPRPRFAPPPPPTPPPPSSAGRAAGVIALSIVGQLNRRFREAQPSADLERVGIILHQFDGWETHGRPWQPCEPDTCRGDELRGRVSCMIAYQGLRKRGDRAGVPLVNSNGGVIVRPSAVSIACAYGIDGATQNYNNPAHPGNDGAGP